MKCLGNIFKKFSPAKITMFTVYYRLLPFSYAFAMTLTQGHIKVKVTVDTCWKHDIAWIMTAVLLWNMLNQLHISFHDSRITFILVILTLLHSCSDSEKIAEVIHVQYWFQQISKGHNSIVMMRFTKSQILTMVQRANTLTARMKHIAPPPPRFQPLPVTTVQAYKHKVK